ncbi:MAG: LysM peptidoglycan-binding domain-containing protein [Chloroflexi bacterium]|nr:LysM peptidoglycan-binding domain-containing protein [Chloroflexota bacterium]
MKAQTVFIFCVALLASLVGCATGSIEPQSTYVPQATPTTHSFFLSDGSRLTQEPVDNGLVTAAPTVANYFSARNTSTPRPTSAPRATVPPPTRDISSLNTESFIIYDDALNEDWVVQDNPDAEVDLASTTQVHAGRKAIAFTPLVDFTTLFFTIEPEAERSFPYEETVGFSFWLNGGDDYIEFNELAVTVTSSNDFAYWRPDDTSVQFPEGEYFSETRLYFLGINGSIPPNTWVQIYVWIDNLIYDPVANYVTGFYIKNDEGFYNTIYIDDLEIIMLAQTSSTADAPAVVDVTPAPERATVVGTSATPESTAVSPPSTATPDDASQTGDDAPVCVVSPPDGWVRYTIQPNDILSSLAVRANVSMEVVISVNCLEPGDVLSIGKTLWLPQLPATSTPRPPSG